MLIYINKHFVFILGKPPHLQLTLDDKTRFVYQMSFVPESGQKDNDTEQLLRENAEKGRSREMRYKIKKLIWSDKFENIIGFPVVQLTSRLNLHLLRRWNGKDWPKFLNLKTETSIRLLISSIEALKFVKASGFEYFIDEAKSSELDYQKMNRFASMLRMKQERNLDNPIYVPPICSEETVTNLLMQKIANNSNVIAEAMADVQSFNIWEEIEKNDHSVIIRILKTKLRGKEYLKFLLKTVLFVKF